MGYNMYCGRYLRTETKERYKMSRTIKQKKKPNHGRMSFQIPQEEKEAFEGLEVIVDGFLLNKTQKARQAFSKYVQNHKRNKKEVE